ncbi:MAG TPA: permease [Actinomycetota bacterium]
MSLATDAQRRGGEDVRLLLRVSAAALLWFALYRVNGPFWNWLLFDAVGLDPDERLGEAIRFFVFDTTKILLLLAGIIFAITVLRSFLSVERTRALLGGRREGLANLAAAGLGVATPFCSCSAVPAFIGFVSAGVPIGVTLSFLIASPLVNEVALVLLYGMFGWKVALLYAGAGLAIATAAGLVLGRLHADRWVEPFVFETPVVGAGGVDVRPTWRDRIEMGREEVVKIVRKIWPYLLVGIGIGAAIHGWLPESFFARYAGPDDPLAVPFAVLLGIPLYSNAAGVLPLVEALYAKGLGMGTLLAFMMAVVALSLPEAILLRRVLKPALIAAFIGVVAAGILLVGYLFNAVL